MASWQLIIHIQQPTRTAYICSYSLPQRLAKDFWSDLQWLKHPKSQSTEYSTLFDFSENVGNESGSPCSRCKSRHLVSQTLAGVMWVSAGTATTTAGPPQPLGGSRTHPQCRTHSPGHWSQRTDPRWGTGGKMHRFLTAPLHVLQCRTRQVPSKLKHLLVATAYKQYQLWKRGRGQLVSRLYIDENWEIVVIPMRCCPNSRKHFSSSPQFGNPNIPMAEKHRVTWS